MLKIKRVYDPVSRNDGKRILVDRLWPRGIKKKEIDEWLKEISPSSELRKWYSHEPAKWNEFKKKYREELQDKEAILEKLCSEAEKRNVTLLYAAREREQNNAAALKEILEAEFMLSTGKSGSKQKS